VSVTGKLVINKGTLGAWLEELDCELDILDICGTEKMKRHIEAVNRRKSDVDPLSSLRPSKECEIVGFLDGSIVGRPDCHGGVVPMGAL